MPHSFSILAADESLIKFAVLVVGAIIWGISAISSAVKKANEQARRRAALQPQAQPAPAPLPVQMSRTVIPARRVMPQQQRQTIARQPAAKRTQSQALQRQAQALTNMSRPAAARQPQPPPLRPAATKATPTTDLSKPAAAVAAVSRTTSGGAGAAAIRRWLRPASLRKQFILTELFQPPLALRESSDE